MGRITDAVKHLIIINVLFFVATQLYGDQMYQWFSLWFPKNQNFGFWPSGIPYVYAWRVYAYSIQYVCAVGIWIPFGADVGKE